MIIGIIIFILKVLLFILGIAILILTIIDAVCMLDYCHESFIIKPTIDWFRYSLIKHIKAISKFLIWLGKRLLLLIVIPTSIITGVLGIITGFIIKPFIVGYEKSENLIDRLLEE